MSARHFLRHALLPTLACAVLATLLVTTAPVSAQGLGGRNEPVARVNELPGVPDACLARPMKCPLGPTYAGKPTLVLWGDSHAWQLIPALKAAIGHRKVNLVAFLFGGCPPFDPDLSTRAEVRAAGPCRQTNHKALTYVTNATRRHQDIRVVLAGGWELYRYALDPLGPDEPGWHEHTSPSIAGAAELAAVGTPRLFRALGRARVPADVVGQMPTVPVNAPACARSEDPYECRLPRAAALPKAAVNRRTLHALVDRLGPPARLIQPSSLFCDSRGCAGRVHGESAWYDDTHISLSLSALLGRYFAPSVRRLTS
ncbi:MAG: hypothetical protein M3237_22645 [Actinomycetota bacterium]|nr:hypothetical protein [Actinomycetota bacterium]